ncbi:hypothetical protein PR048_022277 [Dryococelus australis]|uniref:Uncharacterized protein n=1 Tax=Dryococelus australis TaxID=614101 RepID=A0ABQ9H0K4_9NEOP|nr:hypothetical protein PR048_022277 [Dryococelus australis]
MEMALAANRNGDMGFNECCRHYNISSQQKKKALRKYMHVNSVTLGYMKPTQTLNHAKAKRPSAAATYFSSSLCSPLFLLTNDVRHWLDVLEPTPSTCFFFLFSMCCVISDHPPCSIEESEENNNVMQLDRCRYYPERKQNPVKLSIAIFVFFKLAEELDRRAAVVERVACSPPTKANRVQSSAGPPPDFRKWNCRAMPLVCRFENVRNACLRESAKAGLIAVTCRTIQDRLGEFAFHFVSCCFLRSGYSIPGRRVRQHFAQSDALKRSRIVEPREGRWSFHRIVHRAGRVDIIVARCWRKGIHEDTHSHHAASGRPLQLTPRENQHIDRHVRSATMTTITDTQPAVMPILQHPVSVRTVDRRLHGAGLEAVHVVGPAFALMATSNASVCEGNVGRVKMNSLLSHITRPGGLVSWCRTLVSAPFVCGVPREPSSHESCRRAGNSGHVGPQALVSAAFVCGVPREPSSHESCRGAGNSGYVGPQTLVSAAFVCGVPREPSSHESCRGAGNSGYVGPQTLVSAPFVCGVPREPSSHESCRGANVFVPAGPPPPSTPYTSPAQVPVAREPPGENNNPGRASLAAVPARSPPPFPACNSPRLSDKYSLTTVFQVKLSAGTFFVIESIRGSARCIIKPRRPLPVQGCVDATPVHPTAKIFPRQTKIIELPNLSRRDLKSGLDPRDQGQEARERYGPTHADKYGVARHRHVETQFANQRPVTYSPLSSPANRKRFAARNRRGQTRGPFLADKITDIQDKLEAIHLYPALQE